MATYGGVAFDATDLNGNFRTGTVQVAVSTIGGGTPQLYADRAGASPLGNPYDAADGHIVFFCAGGAYSVVLTQGAETGNIDFLPIGTAQELDQGGLLKTSQLDTDVTLAANSDTKVPAQKAVKTYVDALIVANDAMVFKGVVDCSANPNYPAADSGDTYRVSVAGKIGGGSGVNVEVGDILMCVADGTASGNQATVGADWAIIQANLDGALLAGAADQVITGGARVTPLDLGSLSSAGSNTITPDPGDRPIQKITNDHAGSILPGSNTGQYTLTVINASGAGALTTTGWTLKGDSFDTTSTSKFVCSCLVTSDVKLMTVLKVA